MIPRPLNLDKHPYIGVKQDQINLAPRTAPTGVFELIATFLIVRCNLLLGRKTVKIGVFTGLFPYQIPAPSDKFYVLAAHKPGPQFRRHRARSCFAARRAKPTLCRLG